jgi:hypothetical protein
MDRGDNPMEFSISKLFDREELPKSPDLNPREDFIKLAISRLNYEDGTVSFDFHVSFLLPDALANRYRDLDEGLVLVVNDVDHQDCFASNFTSDAYVPAPGTRKGSNMIAGPPKELSPPSDQELNALSGGWINGEVSFESHRPRSSPGIFTYIVLENYFSNVVGIDLFTKKAVYY